MLVDKAKIAKKLEVYPRGHALAIKKGRRPEMERRQWDGENDVYGRIQNVYSCTSKGLSII